LKTYDRNVNHTESSVLGDKGREWQETQEH